MAKKEVNYTCTAEHTEGCDRKLTKAELEEATQKGVDRLNLQELGRAWIKESKILRTPPAAYYGTLGYGRNM